MGRVMRKRDFMGIQTAKAQIDQDLHFPLTESLDTTKCTTGKQMSE